MESEKCIRTNRWCKGRDELPSSGIELPSSGTELPSSGTEVLQGEFLAEFDAPLVERVDAPDHAFCEDFMFVERNELPEHFGSQLVEANRIAGFVACMCAVRLKPPFPLFRP